MRENFSVAEEGRQTSVDSTFGSLLILAAQYIYI
jgi:hypothetical protein